ncbi:MAG: ABC transporter permease subunit [Armatimonadetes bacterium]|nr:ABC transporter permease subunit [Armatimonadota bacterium]
MAIIPKIGRKTWKMRLVIAGLYIVLSLGALTMVYPFLLMLGTSITSGADVNDFAIVPSYLRDNNALFPKYVEDRYAGDIELVNQYFGTDFAKIESVIPPKTAPRSPSVRNAADDWDRFVGKLPVKYKQAGFEGYASSPSKLKDAYKQFCRVRFHGDIHRLNRIYSEENESFETVTPPFERYKMREWEPDNSPKMLEWIAFKSKLPAYFLRPILIDPAYQSFLKNSIYDASITRLNESWGTNYKSFQEIHLPPTLPSQPGQRKAWEAFVRRQLPFRYIAVDKNAAPPYRAYLKDRYKGSLAQLNTRHESGYHSFDEIELPTNLPTAGAALIDWMDFISKRVPLEYVRAVNVENLYREHLAKRFGTVDAANKAFGTRFASFVDVAPPAYLADWHFCASHAGELRRDFLVRNYATVIGFMLLHGRAVLNTVIFVVAVILIHLIVNPMCAYALSRYSLPYAYKVLLFLLATMAFPAEVAMIPSFLLLKQFHLLNTYWALILPGMANGYAIFLLKGFFDSLPKELYEAGIIDGASEATMFAKITMPMSKPIFAVIALQAFTGAYGAFMYAMLVCQNPKMWTMMVWLYQLQTTAPQYITMAALTLAAVPTLLVFVFAQNVIMRGIIIPSFK